MARREAAVRAVKRVTRNKRYYDRVTIREDGKTRTYYRLWDPKQPREQRLIEYENHYKALATEHRVKRFVKSKRSQVEPRSIPQKKSRTKGKKVYYQSSIKLGVIVRHKNGTPFHYPTVGESNYLMRSTNATEESMKKSILGLRSGGYQELQGWLARFKPGGDVYVFGGWTYRRAYSRTGSFDGDARYLDYKEVRFRGNRRPLIIDHFKTVRGRER